MAAESAASLVGRKLSSYRILSPLGAGGMGEVYLAQDMRLGRKIALKLLPAQFTQDADRVRRFEQELHAGEAEVAATRRGLADLRHLNAVVAMALRSVEAPAEGQRVQVRIPIESVEQAAGPMLRLAPEVEVLRPQRLRRAIRERARAAAELYAR